MMWVLGVIAIGIIACGVFLASDKFGSMPELVDDNPAPRLPEGDFTAENLAEVRFAVTMRGYARHQVEELLDRAGHSLKGDGVARAMTGADVHATAFNVVSRGYHMGQVDLVLDRLAWQFDRPAATPDEASDNHDAVTEPGQQAAAEPVEP